MIELVMLVCAAASPYHCREEKLVFAEPGLSVYACALKGQIAIVKWTKTHPGWRVRKYHCDRVGQFARL